LNNKKTAIATSLVLLLSVLVSGIAYSHVHAASAVCLPVPPPGDGKFGTLLLTAAVVVLSPTTVTGKVNAAGCDFGVYIAASASGTTVTATVTDAKQVGVFNDGATSVTVKGSTVSCTGNHAGTNTGPCIDFSPNGAQTGIDVYYSCTGTGTISSNTINQYQKGGITVRDLDSVTVTGNNVTGLGLVNFIAQNGIEFGFGSCGPTVSTANVGQVTGNTVTDNQYNGNGGRAPPPFISSGILAQAIGDPGPGQIQSALVTTNRAFQNQGNVIVIAVVSP
jgi:hypothetical protein